jgi:SAM-dependent methyltransferase
VETKAILRRLIPAPSRAALRRLRRELPIRIRDAPADFREAIARSDESPPLPPARLRARVGFTGARAEFLDVGRRAARELLAALAAAGLETAKGGIWLDFGCGCGRIARHLLNTARISSLAGVDVDAGHVQWMKRHLPGEWHVIAPMPPTGLAASRFDVIVSVSVFTHLNEAAQDSWLAELVRLLRPGGFLLATTHGPALAETCPGVTLDNLKQLEDRGFLFQAAPGPFSDQAAFHSEGYLQRRWGKALSLRAFLPQGLVGYQDLAVWSKAH